MRGLVGRRDFLHVGFAAGIGLTLTDFLRMKAALGQQQQGEQPVEGPAKSVIFVFLPGGTWPARRPRPRQHQFWFPALGNGAVAKHLDEIAQLLEAQGANTFRIAAYRRAAQTLRDLSEPVQRIFDTEGRRGLVKRRSRRR
jgi:hypothetical protein